VIFIRPIVGKIQFSQYKKKTVEVEIQFKDGSKPIIIPFRTICLISKDLGFYQTRENILRRKIKNGKEIWIENKQINK